MFSGNNELYTTRARRFDTIHDKDALNTLDNLTPIRKQFDEFFQFCKLHYTIDEYWTVDEMLGTKHVI